MFIFDIPVTGKGSASSEVLIFEIAASMLLKISSFLMRNTLNPNEFNIEVRNLSASIIWGSLWYFPSTSTTSFFSRHTKSTINSSIMCWRRKELLLTCSFLKYCHSISSDSVGIFLCSLAKSFKRL